MTKFEILEGCMRMAGTKVYDNDWEDLMKFALVRERVAKLGDQFTLKDSVECEVEAKAFQDEFNESIRDKEVE